MCSPHTETFPDNNALSKSIRNNLFVDGFNSSPGWLLVTRTRGAWWCRYRGHCRSGPRHLSPRSSVCAQEWHSKDIHSHIHSHTPMHTPQKQNPSNHETWLRLLVLLLSSVLVGHGQELSLADASQDFSTLEAFSPWTVMTENRCVEQIIEISLRTILEWICVCVCVCVYVCVCVCVVLHYSSAVMYYGGRS